MPPHVVGGGITAAALSGAVALREPSRQWTPVISGFIRRAFMRLRLRRRRRAVYAICIRENVITLLGRPTDRPIAVPRRRAEKFAGNDIAFVQQSARRRSTAAAQQLVGHPTGSPAALSLGWVTVFGRVYHLGM